MLGHGASVRTARPASPGGPPGRALRTLATRAAGEITRGALGVRLRAIA
ncbi:hypothetical protein [Actinomadura litoris]|uniref:Uncharacterized protein n=1 Tax=Actinomadura litoris TaxID=2678616 RepID=A0A7K1KT02_9ACTN|nr:hypothetical protein [Actinomadura litoris]MUN35299.1 hypothetical protein [Actinomadura litoris]